MRSQIHHLVADAADERAAAPAVTFKDTTVSYGQLWRDIRSFGGALQASGFRRGDRVAVYLDKRIETVVALFGTSAAGGVFVPINPLLRPRQVGYIVRDCAARVLVTSTDRLALLGEELDECKSVEHVVLTAPGPAATGEPGERYTVSDWPTAAAEPALSDGIDADMGAILYTSGSTGQPKGVVLSHRNLVAGAESVSNYIGNRADDVILAALDPDRRPGLASRDGQQPAVLRQHRRQDA